MEGQRQVAHARVPTASGLAIASLVFGIVALAFCCGPFAGIPGVVLGIVALSKIGESRGKVSGKGLAIAGIVTGSVSMLVPLLAIMAVLLLPALARDREQARRVQCRSNLDQLGLACSMYAQDNSESFPEELSRLYPKYAANLSLFKCPTADDSIASAEDIDASSSYVLTPGLRSTGPADAVLMHDKPGNHSRDGANVLFISGEARWMEKTSFEMLFTQPEVGF